jgi:hypothetical protein
VQVNFVITYLLRKNILMNPLFSSSARLGDNRKTRNKPAANRMLEKTLFQNLALPFLPKGSGSLQPKHCSALGESSRWHCRQGINCFFNVFIPLNRGDDIELKSRRPVTQQCQTAYLLV